MSARTSIEWTESTWNPVTGCTQVSPGCDHCYAKTIAERFRGGPAYPRGFDVTLRPHKLDQPLRWRRPRRIFVNSMSDLFHDDVPDNYIAQVFAVMALAPRHTFQVLTKRHARMRSLLSSDAFWKAADISRSSPVARLDASGNPTLTNVWLGVSTENQQWANIRVPALLDTPAAVRWISAEPLLGPINLLRIPPYGDALTDLGVAGTTHLDWVVVGGESGHGSRPMHPDWARSLRDQCTAAGVPFLFKQWGEWAPERDLNHASREAAAAAAGTRRGLNYSRTYLRPDGTGSAFGVDEGAGPGTAMARVGKKAAGRQLDGETWDQYPERVSADGQPHTPVDAAAGCPVSATTADPCPLTAREGPYLLTCCLPAGHQGCCWCNNIQTIDQEN